MRWIWKWLRRLFLLCLAAALAAGLYVGNTVYEDLIGSPWDRILGIRNQTGDLVRVHAREQEWGWEPVEITAGDGTVLAGTYIPRPSLSHHTVILVHGLYSNRSMCLPLVEMYQEMDYNVLLIDLRGHGESGGRHTMWGMREVDDFQAWMEFLHAKDPDVRVGLHGISLGAALSILECGTDEGQDLLFCIADSAYADLMSLGREKLLRWTGDERILLGLDVVDPFFQAAMFFHTGKFLKDITPLEAVSHMRAPALFLHGEDDRLVPSSAAEALGAACSSRRKKVVLFEGAGHAQELALNPEAYCRTVQNFITGR